MLSKEQEIRRNNWKGVEKKKKPEGGENEIA